MPNWPLSIEIRDHIRHQANALAQRMIDLNRLEFPLNLREIQTCASGLTQDQLEMLRRLEKEGLACIQKDKDIHVAFTRALVPELRRGIVLRINLPRHIFVRKITMSVPNSRTRLGDEQALIGRLDGFEPEKRGQIIAWLEGLLKQVRIKEIVTNCVNDLISEHVTPTAAHLKHLWPTLTTVIKPDRHNDRLHVWQERFRNPPERGLSRYTPDPNIVHRYRELLKLCDMQIAAGQLIAPVKTDAPGAIYPVIENWERIPGDITFPLA